MKTQVTFDCADPPAQAAFWAQVFGSVVEDHSALVDQLIADGRMPVDDRIVVGGRSAFRDVAACHDPAGVEPRLFSSVYPRGKSLNHEPAVGCTLCTRMTASPTAPHAPLRHVYRGTRLDRHHGHGNRPADLG